MDQNVIVHVMKVTFTKLMEGFIASKVHILPVPNFGKFQIRNIHSWIQIQKLYLKVKI